MRAIVKHVAALTKTPQVAQPVVGWIMIEVSGGEHDAGCPQPGYVFQVGPSGDATTPVPPRSLCRIEPPSVRQAAHDGTMWPAAALAPAAGALEADAAAEVAPMCGIQTA